MKRRLKDALKRGLFYLYRLGTRLGVHVMPVHYYSPVPNIIELERNRDAWARRSGLPGIAINTDEQLARLREICTPYVDEYAGNAAYREAVAAAYGPGYGYVEAQVLHAVIRHLKPKRIVEVGSGVSTHCMQRALEMNRKEGRHDSTMTCIEPFPSARLRQTPTIELIEASHAVRTGSDVNNLVLEVLPVLAPGVTVHFHDIYLPYDYQRDVLKTFLHWSETSLLRAYLTYNERISILFCLSLLHYDRQDGLRELFPEYDPAPGADGLNPDSFRPFEEARKHFPSSIYLRTA